MSYDAEEGPVYYREIQKNAYLKRIPNETGGSKLRPLGHKKLVLKPMWTLFCVHNGRTPYLEQYPVAECPATLSHRPVWRASLKTARHVTAGVKPHAGAEYDFLIDTNEGPVRMRAPDWEAMQDWVVTLRNKLHELRILSKGENVYCAAPAPAIPRAAARDPTSPLPPTPPVPPDRVPGIELNSPAPITLPTEPDPPQETQPVPEPATEPEIDISNWEDTPMPSTSQESNSEQRKTEKSVAKICGQNICLDDSILKRKTESTDSDEEFFNEIDKISNSIENIDFEEDRGYRQTLVVTEDKSVKESQSNIQATNITVIQVSNKPPHTAIPVLGNASDIFDFNFHSSEPTFINIVNTETNINSENGYGTVFTKESDYGHLSSTTTVNLTDDVNSTSVSSTAVNATDVTVTANEGVYERLCMASTSNDNPLNKVRDMERVRKSSLPNLESNLSNTSNESTYECLFPNNNTVNNTTVTVNAQVNNEVNSNSNTSGNSYGNPSSIPRALRSNVERSHSQNACDRAREHYRRVQNVSPRREGRSDKNESNHNKPIWKRGLTELSLLTRLRGIGQGKRQESPTRQDADAERNAVTSTVKVVHRSRPEGRIDGTRWRSSSLSNGDTLGLVPLRRRQAAALRAEQCRPAVSGLLPTRTTPLLVDHAAAVWLAWSANGSRYNGRTGDRLVALRGQLPKDAAHAMQLIHATHKPTVDILFHRVPLGKIYVLNKRDRENIGIKLDNECNITSVELNSPAHAAGIPPSGRWAVTEVNNRPINLVKGGDEEMVRLSLPGTEVLVLLQPSILVKKLRAALKSNKSLLSKR